MPTGHFYADPLKKLVQFIVAGDSDTAIRLLDASPELAGASAAYGATRRSPTADFFERIAHYMYAGDTALHMAAAGLQPRVVEKLITMGADVHARNRRGAEPLHYAADGGPGLVAWSPIDQSKIIALLIGSGANPNAVDKSGVAPLHRAVRNRSAAAVEALIDGGANLNAPNRSGSTPKQLATKNTGHSGSGTDEAKAQQKDILRLLDERGTV